MNIQFINLCNTYYIILLILPPHSTHKLQFFNIRIFSPLTFIYSEQIDLVIQSNHNLIKIIKYNFWLMFKTI